MDRMQLFYLHIGCVFLIFVLGIDYSLYLQQFKKKGRLMTFHPIPQFPNFFISESGVVLSTKSDKPRILSIRLSSEGYRQVSINGKTCPIHRLVAYAFHGDEYFDGALVRHLDGNKLNNSPYNLRWGSSKENSMDTIKHRRDKNGEAPYSNKLTDCDVWRILFLIAEFNGIYNADDMYRSFAEEYNVPFSTIRDIDLGETWKHLDRPAAWG